MEQQYHARMYTGHDLIGFFTVTYAACSISDAVSQAFMWAAETGKLQPQPITVLAVSPARTVASPELGRLDQPEKETQNNGL
jgi:hypothetical protein